MDKTFTSKEVYIFSGKDSRKIKILKNIFFFILFFSLTLILNIESIGLKRF